MAHLGARQTEDLEVAGSSPACPIPFFPQLIFDVGTVSTVIHQLIARLVIEILFIG